MIRLGATDDDLKRYQVLSKEHLNITTARIDPSLRGQRNTSLAWFWTMDVKNDTDSATGMEEFYRVHWLKAKAWRDRWAEEVTLLVNEMDWTLGFFEHRASE
ncbi:hypothetical protein PILCRDRAFT_33210, partial [Piloderma croceum F 1598]